MESKLENHKHCLHPIYSCVKHKDYELVDYILDNYDDYYEYVGRRCDPIRVLLDKVACRVCYNISRPDSMHKSSDIEYVKTLIDRGASDFENFLSTFIGHKNEDFFEYILGEYTNKNYYMLIDSEFAGLTFFRDLDSIVREFKEYEEYLSCDFLKLLDLGKLENKINLFNENKPDDLFQQELSIIKFQ
jgi:hypothetical protein